jgi:hypothetical protein
LQVDTGKRPVKITWTYRERDWVLVGDNENRTRAYSLPTGKKSLRFEAYALPLTAVGVLVIEKKLGRLVVYGLNSLEKQNHLTFHYDTSAWALIANGNRRLVPKANQIVPIFDTEALDRPPESPHR